MTSLFQVPASFWGPQISNISSIGQTVFLKVSISHSNAFVCITERRALCRCECTMETDLAIIDGVHRLVVIVSFVDPLEAFNASGRVSQLEPSSEFGNAARICSNLDVDYTINAPLP